MNLRAITPGVMRAYLDLYQHDFGEARVQPEELRGKYLIVKDHKGNQAQVIRKTVWRRVYFSPAIELEEFFRLVDMEAKAHVQELKTYIGPGRVWFLGDPVHVESVDGRVTFRRETTGMDEHELRLRTWYGFLPDPPLTHNEYGEICP